MAQRLATEFVKTCLRFSELDWSCFIRMFHEHECKFEVKILDNGQQEIVFRREGGEVMTLHCESTSDGYVCTGSCRFINPELANLMRKVISTCHGSATVHRIYADFKVLYEYELGTVVYIAELRGDKIRTIFEANKRLRRLEQLYSSQAVESEIRHVRTQINSLLDLWNQIPETGIRGCLDRRLRQLSHRLFVLEA